MASVHDNQALFDAVQLNCPGGSLGIDRRLQRDRYLAHATLVIGEVLLPPARRSNLSTKSAGRFQLDRVEQRLVVMYRRIVDGFNRVAV